jgi:two-component system response regulator FixJ
MSAHLKPVENNLHTSAASIESKAAGEQPVADVATICVVNCDSATRQALSELLQAGGHRVKAYASARTFLVEMTEDVDCVVAELHMQGMDVSALQEHMARRNLNVPVVIATEHGSVQQAVQAMKTGAVDYITDPRDSAAILAATLRAVELGRTQRKRAALAASAKQRINLLTQRERQVLERLMAGQSSKVAAYDLGISPRTIEVHRAQIRDKLKASNIAELVRTAMVAYGDAWQPAAAAR